jgi:hypothetical protein
MFSPEDIHAINNLHQVLLIGTDAGYGLTKENKSCVLEFALPVVDQSPVVVRVAPNVFGSERLHEWTGSTIKEAVENAHESIRTWVQATPR